MVRKAEVKTVEGLRGGKGKLKMHHILKPEELNGHGRQHDLLRMPTHSSSDYHKHPCIDCMRWCGWSPTAASVIMSTSERQNPIM